MNILKFVLPFFLGILVAFGLQYTGVGIHPNVHPIYKSPLKKNLNGDATNSPDAPIQTMDQASLRASLNSIMDMNGKLIEQCHDKNGDFNSKTCKPALEEFNGYMFGAGEDLYCSQC